MTRYVCYALLCVIFMSSCYTRPTTTPEIEIEPLFDIPIGLSQERLYYGVSGAGNRFQDYRLHMRDGIITVTSGLTNKVLIFNSYGDLIQSIYDPTRNPPSSYLRNQEQNEDGTYDPTIATRTAISYPFNHIGAVATAGDSVTYIVDTVDEEQMVTDERAGVALNQVVLRFENGNPVPVQIGEEGVSGSPFPPIRSIHVVGDDELVVVCDIDSRWLLFWYTPRGSLRYAVEITRNSLPALVDESDAIEIASVVPALAQERVYVLLHYYTYAGIDNVDTSDRPVELVSRVYWLELPSGTYESFVEIPSFTPNNGSETFELLNDTVDDKLFFKSHIRSTEVDILTMALDGRVLLRRSVTLPDESTYFMHYHLSPRGIITTLNAFENRVSIDWWRVDKILATRR